MFFITKRKWTRYFCIIYNVDLKFIYDTLTEAIDALKNCIYYNECTCQLSDYCFVRIEIKSNFTYKLFWSQTFNHEGIILKEFRKYEYEELSEKQEYFIDSKKLNSTKDSNTESNDSDFF